MRESLEVVPIPYGAASPAIRRISRETWYREVSGDESQSESQ